DIAHDRVRQVARASISPEEAAELHERLATTFELGIDPLRAAGHWREAGHPERAAQRFADAAARAAEALAFDRAVALYETALELGTWPAERLRELEVGLADALANAGRGAASAGHYLTAARGAGPVKALELRRRGTEELIRSGRLDEGRAVAAAALADAGLGFARSPLRALLGQRALLRIRGRRFRRRAVEEIAPRELARVDLCWSLSSGLGLMDPVQGAHFQVRSLLLALRAGEPYRVARGVAGEAAYAAAQGQAARARALLDEAARIVADLDNPHATGIVSLMSGLAGHLLGRFAQGIEHLDAASRVFRERCVGTVWELNAARQFSLECLYYLGELPRFRISAAEGLREANDRGSVYATTTLRTGLANAAWLLDDEPARARHEVAEAKSGWSSRGYHIQHWYSLFAETQIALYEGDGAAAHALVEGAWPLLRRSHLLMIEHTRLVAVHLRARAALAAAANGEGAPLAAARLKLARRCGEHLARSRGAWSRVFAGLVEGAAASLARDDAKALASYRRAAAAARLEGLSLFAAAAELAAAELSADGAAAAAARHWMSERGAKNPRALTRMLAAGARAVG
ncbi:MAG TPA: ATP-binding protein, partial [Polyangia bacterium]|nr:ATP-binding protein [Polyangia bacterium]